MDTFGWRTDDNSKLPTVTLAKRIDKIKASLAPVSYSNDDDFTRSHLVLDVRMAEVAQRFLVPSLCDFAAAKFSSHCSEFDFGCADEKAEFRAALCEAEQLLEESSALSRELVTIAWRNRKKLFSDISASKVLEYAPRPMNKIIKWSFTKTEKWISDEPGNRHFIKLYDCPHCSRQFRVEMEHMAAGWVPCPKCGWGADLGWWENEIEFWEDED